MTVFNDLFDIPERKQGINSKRKGDKNEVSLAKFMTSWTAREFFRTPGSGGLGKNLRGASGDITTGDGEDFIFTVETKHYKKIVITEQLRANSVIYKFWRQVVRDSKRYDTEPLLAVRENRMPKGEYIIFFGTDVSNILNNLYKLISISKGNFDGYSIYGFSSNDLLDNVGFRVFQNIVKNIEKWLK